MGFGGGPVVSSSGSGFSIRPALVGMGLTLSGVPESNRAFCSLFLGGPTFEAVLASIAKESFPFVLALDVCSVACEEGLLFSYSSTPFRLAGLDMAAAAGNFESLSSSCFSVSSLLLSSSDSC